MKIARDQRMPFLWLLCLAVSAPLIASRDAKSQTSMRGMKGSESGSGALAFSPDGKVLAGSQYFPKDRMLAVRLWDLKTAKLKRTLRMLDEISGLDFSPDGRTLATGSGSQFTGHVRLWDVQTGKLKRTLASGSLIDGQPVGIGPVGTLAFSPNGKTIAVGIIWEGEYSVGGEVFLLDARTGSKTRKFKMPSFVVTALAFSSGGRLLAASCDDGRIRLCSTKTGEVIRTTTKQSSVITAVRFTPDGQFIISTTSDQIVKLWSVKTGTLARIVGKVGGKFRTPTHSFAISKDAKTIAVSGEEPEIKLARIK